MTKSDSTDDGKRDILSDPTIQCTLIDESLDDDDTQHDKARELLKLIRTRNIHMPVFPMADRDTAPSINAEVMSIALERCKLARQAVELVGSLIDQHGVYGTGETLIFADPREARVLEMCRLHSGRDARACG